MVERIDRLKRKREGGTSVVEMAIVLPLLLLLVFAIGDFGIAYTRWVSLTNAAREGARAGVVFREPCNAGQVEDEIRVTVSDFADSSGLTDVTTDIVGACTGTDTPLQVTSTAPYNYVALSALAGLSPTLTLSARTVMRNE